MTDAEKAEFAELKQVLDAVTTARNKAEVERDEAKAESAAFLQWLEAQQGWEAFWADGFLGEEPVSRAKQNLQAIRVFAERKGRGLAFLAEFHALTAERDALRRLNKNLVRDLNAALKERDELRSYVVAIHQSEN